MVDNWTPLAQLFQNLSYGAFPILSQGLSNNLVYLFFVTGCLEECMSLKEDVIFTACIISCVAQFDAWMTSRFHNLDNDYDFISFYNNDETIVTIWDISLFGCFIDIVENNKIIN